MIREDEPPKPSTRLSTLGDLELTTLAKYRKAAPEKLRVLMRGDLDWIVMKALEKDRTRRYDTANGLAMDVGRFLADEPVLAGAPSAAYKFRKFVRRNKAAFGVAAAMVSLLVAGIAATTWQAVRATGEARRASAAEEIAEQRLGDAEAISEFLTDMFKRPRPGKEKGASTSRWSRSSTTRSRNWKPTRRSPRPGAPSCRRRSALPTRPSASAGKPSH